MPASAPIPSTLSSILLLDTTLRCAAGKFKLFDSRGRSTTQGSLWTTSLMQKHIEEYSTPTKTFSQCWLGAGAQKFTSLLYSLLGRVRRNARAAQFTVVRGATTSGNMRGLLAGSTLTATTNKAQAAAYPPKLCATSSRWRSPRSTALRPPPPRLTTLHQSRPPSRQRR